MASVFDDWYSVPAESTGGVVALGTSTACIAATRRFCTCAREGGGTGAPLLAFTFEPHPRGFQFDTGPFRLTLAPAKTRLLAGAAA